MINPIPVREKRATDRRIRNGIRDDDKAVGGVQARLMAE
jgi:hypothetical protein